VPLPDTMTLDQMKPQLLAAGVDVDALVTALTPVLTPEGAATLSGFAAEPITIEYVLSFDGQAAVEPVTAEVSVSTRVGGCEPRAHEPPGSADASHYPGVPEAVTVSAALDDPQPAPRAPVRVQHEQTLLRKDEAIR
jgi:hypothetical protein